MLSKSDRIYSLTHSTSETIHSIAHLISDIDELEMAMIIDPTIINSVKNQIQYCPGMPLDLIDHDVYTTKSLIKTYSLYPDNKIIERKLVNDNVPIVLDYNSKNYSFIQYLIGINYPNITLTILISEIDYILVMFPSVKIVLRELASTYQQLVKYRKYNIMPSDNIIVGSKPLKKYEGIVDDYKETCSIYPDCSKLLDKFPSLKSFMQLQ